jgi:hypothetical protein
MQERTVTGQAEAAGKAHHVLFCHAERQELVRVTVAEAVDLAGRGEVG